MRIRIRRGEVQSIPTPPPTPTPEARYATFGELVSGEYFIYMAVTYIKLSTTTALREVGNTVHNFYLHTEVRTTGRRT